MVLFAPQVKEPAVAERDVFTMADTETDGRAIDPIGSAFEFSVVANGRFVDDAVPFAIGPLGAPFFVAKRSYKAKRLKNLRQRVAVRELGLGLDAVFVPVPSRGASSGEPLVRERPSARVAADAKDFSARAQPAIGSVIKRVALEAARSLQPKPCRFEPLHESGRVCDAEFDLGFDGHRYQRVYGRWRGVAASGENGVG